MAYSFGQIEIYTKDKVKKIKKKGYTKKLRAACKNIDFIPVKNGFKGYQ